MLEERERGQADGWLRMKRIASWTLGGLFACALILALSLRETRDLLVSLLRDQPAMQEEMAPAKPALPPAKAKEETIKRLADMVSEAGGGTAVGKDDIEFGMELLNFMQGPPQADEVPETPGPKQK